MDFRDLIITRQKDFLRICRDHQVGRVYAFGSVITEKFDPAKSDIDLLVSVDIVDPIEKGEVLLSLWDALESFFGRKVDLLTEDSIRNPFLRASIEQSKRLVYDGSGEKIFS